MSFTIIDESLVRPFPKKNKGNENQWMLYARLYEKPLLPLDIRAFLGVSRYLILLSAAEHSIQWGASASLAPTFHSDLI